jgi:hypothetical protein
VFSVLNLFPLGATVTSHFSAYRARRAKIRPDRFSILVQFRRMSSLIAVVYLSGSCDTVTSTRAPFLSFTSSPCSSVNTFSKRRFRWRRSAPSTATCAFSGWLGRGDGIIFLTVPGMVVLGCSGIRAVSSFISAILADLAIRGLAISSLTPACDALPVFFLAFLCGIHPPLHRDKIGTVPLSTVRIVRHDFAYTRFMI